MGQDGKKKEEEEGALGVKEEEAVVTRESIAGKEAFSFFFLADGPQGENPL